MTIGPTLPKYENLDKLTYKDVCKLEQSFHDISRQILRENRTSWMPSSPLSTQIVAICQRRVEIERTSTSDADTFYKDMETSEDEEVNGYKLHNFSGDLMSYNKFIALKTNRQMKSLWNGLMTTVAQIGAKWFDMAIVTEDFTSLKTRRKNA